MREIHLVELSLDFDYEGEWTQIVGAFDDPGDAKSFADSVRSALPEPSPASRHRVHEFSIRTNFRYAPDPAYFSADPIAYQHDEAGGLTHG